MSSRLGNGRPAAVPSSGIPTPSAPPDDQPVSPAGSVHVPTHHASAGPAHAKAGLLTGVPGTGFPTLVGITVAATAAHLVLMLVTPSGSLVALWVSDLSAAVAAGLAGVLCLRTASVSASGSAGQDRAGWALLGLGAFSWAAGELVWSAYELVLHQQTPFPSLADVGYLGMIPLALAGMVLLIGRTTAGLRMLLDGLVISGALLVVGWAVVLGPIYRGDGDGLAKALSLAYPAGDVALASMVILLLARAEDRRRAAFMLLAGGMLALSVADGGFAYLTQAESFVVGGPLDTAWFAGFLLIGLGAAYAFGQTAATEPVRRPWVALPYVPVTIAVLTMTISVAYGVVDVVQVVTAGVVVVLVMVRQVVMLRDDMSLTRELEKTVQELRDREEQLRYLAFHDPLTGLANRALFMDRTEHALSVHARESSLLAVLYVDLDGFKEVNDELGHYCGDILLTAVAARLRRCVRGSDTLARLGGDEFAILAERISNAVEAESMAARIVETLAVPFGPAEGIETAGEGAVADQPLRISGSVGAAVCAGGEKAGELLRRADHAMYSAKVTGRGRHVTLLPVRLPLPGRHAAPQ